MSDHAVEQTVINAPLSRVYEVLVDFDAYTDWAKNLKESRVLERNGDGAPLTVEFRAAAMGRSTRYVLRYDLSGAPETFSWNLEDGDIMRRLDGSYELRAVDDDTTDVTYTLDVELRLPLPGFVKRRAESLIIGTALRDLKHHIESA